jgi:hypothetical protein
VRKRFCSLLFTFALAIIAVILLLLLSKKAMASNKRRNIFIKQNKQKMDQNEHKKNHLENGNFGKLCGEQSSGNKKNPLFLGQQTRKGNNFFNRILMKKR